MVVRGTYGRMNPLSGFVNRHSPSGWALPKVAICKGSPAVALMAASARKDDWQSIERLFQVQQDLHWRDMVIEGLVGEIWGRPKWLDTWVEARPGEYLPLLFRGAHAIAWAWEARGGQRALFTSRRRFDRFFDRLRTARLDLEEAARRAPSGDAGALAFQLTLARGLQYPKPDLLTLFDKVQQRSPGHPVALWSMVQGMAPKWGGSIDAMLSVARQAASAELGSSAHVAVVSAHIEAAFQVGSGHWRQPGVRDEIIAAAQRSIWLPEHLASPMALRDHNYFLWAFWGLAERQPWRAELRVVRGRLTMPFAMYAIPTAPYCQMLLSMHGPFG
jgi:hypothetical protein